MFPARLELMRLSQLLEDSISVVFLDVRSLTPSLSPTPSSRAAKKEKTGCDDEDDAKDYHDSDILCWPVCSPLVDGLDEILVDFECVGCHREETLGRLA